MSIKELLKEQFSNLTDDAIVAVHNIYCDNNNDVDSMIYSMDELEDIMYSVDKFKLLRMAFYGNFNPNDDYFAFNGYGNLISFGYAKRLDDFICEGDIINDVLENPELYSEYFEIEDMGA